MRRPEMRHAADSWGGAGSPRVGARIRGVLDTASDDRSAGSGAGHTVRLRLLGPLARLAGQRETSCAVPDGATVRDLLLTVAARYGPEFAAALLRAPGELHTHVRVFVDGADADPQQPLVLGPAAAREITVLVMPIFEGGSR